MLEFSQSEWRIYVNNNQACKQSFSAFLTHFDGQEFALLVGKYRAVYQHFGEAI
jgi:hypothetical protein